MSEVTLVFYAQSTSTVISGRYTFCQHTTNVKNMYMCLVFENVTGIYIYIRTCVRVCVCVCERERERRERERDREETERDRERDRDRDRALAYPAH